MKSRAARLTVGVLPWIVLGAAASFIVYSDRQTTGRRDALAAFDLRAGAAVDMLADARAGEQAYVAAGQGVAFWMPKVDTLLASAAGAIDDLHEHAISAAGRKALSDAAASLTDLAALDKRARDYIRSSQSLMASDLVFSEAGETAAEARRQVETARLEERQAADAFEARTRMLQAGSAAGAAALTLILVSLLAFGSSAAAVPPVIEERSEGLGHPLHLDIATPPRPAAEARAEIETRPSPADNLKAVGDLCTDIGRLSSVDGLEALLAGAADLIGATGLIVWMGSAEGADLRAVAGHGYSARTLSRLPAVPKTADNAAAAAYRTSTLQVVSPAGTGQTGAVVAPLLSPAGCVGALAAEIANGGQASPRVRAISAIIAAQLASVLGGAPAAMAEPAAPAARTAGG